MHNPDLLPDTSDIECVDTPLIHILEWVADIRGSFCVFVAGAFRRCGRPLARSLVVERRRLEMLGKHSA
jgi:hypothetical protein